MLPLPPASAYRFCTRCWMPVAPIRRCLCPPEPYPPDATPARVVGEHPALLDLAAAVAAGRYADDTATHEQRWLDFLVWLVARGKLGEQVVYTVEVVGDGEAHAQSA